MGSFSWVGSTLIAVQKASIYFIYSKKHHFIYVGQTFGKGGVLGRLTHHLCAGEHSSFIRRLNKGLEGIFPEIDDLCVVYYALGDDDRFNNLESSYREGVEYLVQKELRKRLIGYRPWLKIISWVRYNPTANNVDIENHSLKAVSLFENYFNKE